MSRGYGPPVEGVPPETGPPGPAAPRSRVEALPGMVLDVLRDRVAVVSPDGRIVLANAAWRDAGPADGELSGSGYPLDSDYVEALRGLGGPPATDLAGGVEGILEGAHNTFHLTYKVVAAEPRWLAVRVVPLESGGRRGAVVLVEDVTARIQFEERLLSSETRFRQIAENIREVFFLLDPETGRFLYVSPAFGEIWGRPPQSLEEDPGTFLESLHPDDRERIAERLAHREDAWDEEYRILQPDGSMRWIRARSFPIQDARGEVYRVAGVATDVTERRLAEGALRRSGEELREIIDRIPAGVAIHRGGEVLYANECLHAYLGLGADDSLVGVQLLDLVHPDEKEAVAERITLMGRGIEPAEPAELRMRHREGRYVTLFMAPVRVIRYQGKPTNLVVVWDVSELRDTEAALRDSEERYRAIFQSSAVGIALLDLQGRGLTLNPVLVSMLGLEEGDPSAFSLLTRLHPSDAEENRQAFQELASGEGDRYESEQRFRSDNGKFVWVRATLSLVRSAGGEPLFVIAVLEDITEKKALEEQLRLSQRIESIGRLAGGIAHDFNNLITVISGHTDLLLESVSRDDPLRADLEDIRAAANRAASLTGQLLAFSRRQVLQPRVLNLNQVIEGLQGMLQRIIGEDVELRFRPGADLGSVRADPAQVEQVILNLAVNARDAMPRGGELLIRTANVELDDAFVRTNIGARPGPFVQIEVQDSGEGMDPATLAHVFEPFFTTKDPGRGTGLGLAMVYGIVKQSDGYISVESEPGIGTTMRIYLPRVVEWAPYAAPPRPTEAPEGSETILLVEDEGMVRALAQRILVSKGYRVLTAASGVEGLEVARKHDGRIELLLTDVVMPKMGGRELAEVLVKERSETRVLFISGYTDDAIVRHGVLDRSAAFLQKPFTPDTLARKVRAVLDAPAPGLRPFRGTEEKA